MVGPLEHEAEHDQVDADQDRVAELLLDRAREQRANDRAGDGRQQQQPREAGVDRVDGAHPDRVERGDEIAREVAPEVPHRGDERAEVQRDVERLLQRVVAVEVVPAEKVRDEEQVPARRDGQELGQALDDAEDDGVES